MRIELTRDNLLSQLPDGELPETLILEGREVELSMDPAVIKYPKEYHYFTKIEWDMWKRLVQGEAHWRHLATYANPKKFNHANVVSVHIKGIRHKMVEFNSPWEIRTRRGRGMYSLVKKAL